LIYELFAPHQEASFSFTLIGPLWKRLIANGYFLSATEARNLALWCERNIFSWIGDGRKPAATYCHSLMRTADLQLLVPAGSVIEFQLRPQFLREEPPLLVCFFISLSSSCS
jgi:hypothetical protein